jgi:TatD DNase family protein
VAEGCREEDSQVRRESPVLIPDAMDSHMHLDRSLRRLRMDPRMGIQELLARRPRPAPKQKINVVGGVLVYCDPKTWPENPEKLNLPEGWFVAVGVHPKHALDFGDFYFDRLSRLLDSPAVAALGEVGIDCSEGAKSFGIQSSTLKWVLELARPYMPLVFHIRASGDNPQATDALYREVLGLTLDKVPNTLQSIHLHCFNGDEATVKLWSDAYPGTHFGFSSMVKGFGDRPKRGLRAVPGNRLLLESDSPHLPDVAGSINHPAHLFRVAEEVAQVRGQSPLDILRAGIANGQALYRRK